MNACHPCSFVAILFAGGVLALGAVGEAQVGPTLVLTEADNGTVVSAVVGQGIVVDLRGNLTTGYAWELASASGDSVVTNGAMSYTVDPGGGVGVGGTFSFPFLAAKEGDTALGFDYRRSGDTTPAKSFAVTIHVTSAQPRLSIRLSNKEVVISWPIAGSTNFFLEGATSLEPAQWAALNVLPLPEGTNCTVTLGNGGAGLYFRLRLE
jgi:predicted secreted protein